MNRRVPQLKKIKLDIGCGERPNKGYVGMDVRDCGQEIVWDARQGIPFPDNSVDEILTSHFLEHLDDAEGIDFIQECMRVLKHEGQMKNRLPHLVSDTAFYFGHKTFWNEARVNALQRMTEKIEPFIIIMNERKDHELVFVLQKK